MSGGVEFRSGDSPRSTFAAVFEAREIVAGASQAFTFFVGGVHDLVTRESGLFRANGAAVRRQQHEDIATVATVRMVARDDGEALKGV